MFDYLRKIWNSREIRNRILITFGFILLIRFVSTIPVPGTNIGALQNALASNEFLGVFSLLTGGSMANFSILLMGVAPYINASIVLQLMTVVIPKLENLSKEGDQGRQKIASYTRWLTIPFAFLQSYGMILLLNRMGMGDQIVTDTSFANLMPMMLYITAGTIFLMWIGEIMTEHGIGNGISVIIFANIVSSLPNIIGQQLGLAEYEPEQLLTLIVVTVLTALLTAFVVLMTEAQRNIPITYAGRSTKGAGSTSFMPIRLNQAGMIPIIFAVSLVTFPQVLASFFTDASSESIRNAAKFVLENFSENTWWYPVALFVFVFLFTYFYVSVTFKPEEVAESIQKRGGFIPGIRPGENTIDFIGKTSRRLNLWGGLFLAFVSVSPFVISGLFSEFALPSVPLLISGAGMIIVVGVVLEIIRQINSALVMHDYEKIG